MFMPPVKESKAKKSSKLGKVLKVIMGASLAIALLLVVFNPNNKQVPIENVSYSVFLDEMTDSTNIYVNPVSSNNYEVTAVMDDGSKIVTNVAGDTQLATIHNIALDEDIDLTNGEAPTESNSTGTVVMWVAVFGIVGLVIWGSVSMVKSTFSGLQGMAGGASGGGKPGANEMTKSKAQLIKDTGVSLDQVAGIDDEKEDILEVIAMIKHADKYIKAGAEVPKGIMLSGAPGCGKTLLAKAIAHEAGVPFYSVSGSDFVEMYVGVGAARIRDTFDEARKHPEGAIIFFDEIDAVAKKRNSGPGSNDERESTLNALLTELDGFKSQKDKIFVLGATNRVELLDPALLRPGRFERKIIVPVPDQHGREQILSVYAKNKPLAKDVKLETVAKLASGFSGAELKSLLNEAVLMMMRNREKEITMEHISESIDRVIMGPARKSHKYSEHEKRLVATHEAGHAVIGLKLKNAEEVVKITIIPRGDAGGYCMSTPKEERFVQTGEEIRERICGLLGGRIAEELVFGSTTTGAHNDLERCYSLARSLVMDYGLSSLGVAQLRRRSGSEVQDYSLSERTKERVDEEINKIIGMCYEETRDLIRENMDLLNLIADTLIDKETINKEEIQQLVEQNETVNIDENMVAVQVTEPCFIEKSEE